MKRYHYGKLTVKMADRQTLDFPAADHPIYKGFVGFLGPETRGKITPRETAFLLTQRVF
jgi:hypothetical protein